MRPLTYFDRLGNVRGHYAVAQRSGAIVGSTQSALDHHAAVRWAPTDQTSLFVLMRLRVGLTFISAVTTATEFIYRAIIARGFTVDFTVGTAISMVGVTKTNTMRSGTMNPSLMGTAGPRIATTLIMSGQTLTADAAPFAMTTFQNPSTTLGASAVTIQVGAGTPMATLYEWTGLGQHPVVLGQNEGIIVQPVLAGPGAGTYALHTEWTWAEVLTL